MNKDVDFPLRESFSTPINMNNTAIWENNVRLLVHSLYLTFRQRTSLWNHYSCIFHEPTKTIAIEYEVKIIIMIHIIIAIIIIIIKYHHNKIER